MDKKWNLQDIKPARGSAPQDRPISTERPPAPKRRRSASETDVTPRRTDSDGTISLSIENGREKKRHGLLIAVVALILIFGSIVAASYLLRGADITVYPRWREPNVNAVFTTYQTPTSAEQLAHEVMTLEAEGERQVAASGQQAISEQATGVVTIFKSTPGVQRLITNTRLEDSSGRIFRLVDPVVVPGAVDGSPGAIQAEVFASEPGEDYNLSAGNRFTVPGLESDAELFNAIYAENEAAFSGGFDGQRFIIDEGELATAKQALQMELRDALLERLPTEQPAGFVSFPESIAFVYETLPAVEYGDNLATIKEKAVLQVPLYRAEDLAGFLATATVPGYEGGAVRIDDHTVLSFEYEVATTTSANIANEDSLSFTLAGRPLIVWTYDEGKLATDLMGANRTALNQVLQAYPAIERARAEIRPFWKRTFPTNINEVKITEIVKEEAE